jgi:crossover junction endodeoxyribonuclease RuvC
MPLIVGVDPGIAVTGIGVIRAEGSALHHVHSEAVTPPRKGPFEQRLLVIFRRLGQVLDQHRPDAVALEDIFFARNVKSAIKLAHVRGAVMAAAADRGIPVSEYAPLSVKKAVVGVGQADKVQVQQMVKMLLCLEVAPSPLDVSDALAVAVCHANTSSTLVRLDSGGDVPTRGRRSGPRRGGKR